MELCEEFAGDGGDVGHTGHGEEDSSGIGVVGDLQGLTTTYALCSHHFPSDMHGLESQGFCAVDVSGLLQNLEDRGPQSVDGRLAPLRKLSMTNFTQPEASTSTTQRRKY